MFIKIVTIKREYLVNNKVQFFKLKRMCNDNIVKGV